MTQATVGSSRLPQLSGERFVTDGGIETDLIHHHGLQLPHFAAFPLVEDAEGQALLERYYGDYASIARRAGVGLFLEAPTWRANPDWGRRVGYTSEELVRANLAAVALLHRLREQHQGSLSRVLVGGVVGPRESGWSAGPRIDADEAAAYHGPQVRAFAEAGVDLVSAHTLSEVGEAVGVVRSAREVGLPVAIAFTVEVDGLLATGATLAATVALVDAVAPPDYFLVNCAHPDHIERAVSIPGRWRERVVGLLSNASTQSHAQLEEATVLDEGDPHLLAAAHSRLEPLLPGLSVVGGCCGTDSRHVAALWGVA
jgi:S-methylmethionine-dependent homocysteine/selenocysteine methylase